MQYSNGLYHSYPTAVAGLDNRFRDDTGLNIFKPFPAPQSPAPAPQRIDNVASAARRRDDTQAWKAYVADHEAHEQRARIMTTARRQAAREATRRLVLRTFLALIVIGLLIYGCVGLLATGAPPSGLAAAASALVTGGACFCALVILLAER